MSATLIELRAADERHAGECQRVVAAVGTCDAPDRLIARVRELDGFVTEADARIRGMERDLEALNGPSDAEALREALVEFDVVWASLEGSERARVLTLVLDEVVVDGATGEAELRFRGSDDRQGAVS